MIDRNMRILASSSSSTSTRQQRQQKPCFASTVAPPITFSTKQGVIGFKKLVSGVTLRKVNSFGSGNKLPFDDALDAIDDASRMALHDLCGRGHPKLCDVVGAFENNPTSLEARNESGQYPLHVAVANAVSPEVIMYLVLKFPKACTAADMHGKYPLHYATLSTGWIVKGGGIFEDDKDFVHPEYVNMVQLICKAHSAALVHEDNDGRNPIEYALLDDAPGDMIRNLQRSSCQFQRARAAESKIPLRSHVVVGKCA